MNKMANKMVANARTPKAQRGRRNRKQRASGALMNPVGPGNAGRLGLRAGGNFATTRRSQVIEEDEYIGDVLATANNFNVVQYACNPGQAVTFPWGNKIAQLYEKYSFEAIEFYYKREVSEFATAGTTGKVILSFDYDASDGIPTTKQQMEDTVPHSDGMPSEPIIRLPLDVACMRNGPARYVRPGALPANTDIKTYDVGTLNVATYGLASTSGALGELRVRYRVRFSEPVLEPASVVGGVVHFSSVSATTANNFAGAVLQPGGSPTMTGITLGVNTVVFPAGMPGNYLLLLSIAGGTSASQLGAITGTGLTGLNLYGQSGVRDTNYNAVSLAGTTTSSAMLNEAITLTTSGGTGTISGPSTIVGTGTMDLFIISLPSTVLTSSVAVGDVLELRDQISELRDMVRMLVRRPRADSGDFIVAEEPSSSSTAVQPVSDLSKSTLGLIGELIARKSNSRK